jgi:hypothetical protein
MREEITGNWRKLHYEKFHNLCPSPNIIVVTKSRRRWVAHATCKGKLRNVYNIVIRTPNRMYTCGWKDNIVTITSL